MVQLRLQMVRVHIQVRQQLRARRDRLQTVRRKRVRLRRLRALSRRPSGRTMRLTPVRTVLRPTRASRAFSCVFVSAWRGKFRRGRVCVRASV